MSRTPEQLTADERAFLTERHLATLTTLREDGTPHVVAMAFGFEETSGRVLMITRLESVKVRNIDATGYAVVSQLDGPRWLSLEGPARVLRDAEGIAEAVAAFERRYRPASPRSDRVGIEIEVTRVIGRA
jgi:PPOX class probable F420-dependent enzyme